MSETPETAKKLIEGWLSEQEGFAIRAERLPDPRADFMPWLLAACQMGMETERERCANIVFQQFAPDQGYDMDPAAVKAIKAIRA